MARLPPARKAIEDATDLPEAERTAHGAVVDAHASILDAAKTSRLAALDAKRDEEEAAAREASNKVALTKKTAITAEGTPPADTTTAASRPFDRTGTE